MRTRTVSRLLLLAATSVVLEMSCGGGGSGGGATALTVYGTVTDYDGKPVAGMYVTAERIDDPIHVDPRTLEAVRTGADGAFELAIPAPSPPACYMMCSLGGGAMPPTASECSRAKSWATGRSAYFR